MKNNVVASCTLEEYETTITGEHLLSRTEGYGAEGALTTVYSYDDSGRLISSASPNAGNTKPSTTPQDARCWKTAHGEPTDCGQ